MVGLLPLCAATVVEPWQRENIPRAIAGLMERLRRIPELGAAMHPTGKDHYGVNERGLFAILNPERLRRVLSKMLDEKEFLGPYLYYGDNFKIECPTGSGNWMNLFEVSQEISNRLTRIFLRDEQGKRPVYGGTEKFQFDPHWRDHLLFFEYFHGDNGAGLGASHQTGWTGLVAKFIQLYGLLDPTAVLKGGKKSAFEVVAGKSNEESSSKPAIKPSTARVA